MIIFATEKYTGKKLNLFHILNMEEDDADKQGYKALLRETKDTMLVSLCSVDKELGESSTEFVGVVDDRDSFTNLWIKMFKSGRKICKKCLKEMKIKRGLTIDFEEVRLELGEDYNKVGED